MSVAKILMFIVALNVFLYLSGYNLFDHDILDRFVNIDGDNVVDYAGGDTGIGGNVPDQATAGSLTADTQGFSFIDALGITWDVIKFLLNIIFAPIGLFVAAGFPLIVQLGLGLPIGIAYIIGLIKLLRGVGA